VSRHRQAVLIVLAVGITLWLTSPLGLLGEHEHCPLWRWIVALIAGAIGALTATNTKLQHVSDRFNQQSPRRRFAIAVSITIIAAAYFVLTALNQDRDFFPFTHDECSYAIQTQMIAHGHLWMPQHPLADFFDSFYLITRRVYASMYFPGTAMLNAPAIWLHLPFWCIPVLIAGAIVGLVYRIIAEMVDPLSGLLAAFLIVSLSWFRLQSIMLMSQLPELFLGLLMIWAWLRWRASGYQFKRWLLLIGILGGWAAITRPLDSVCFISPIGVAVVGNLILQKRRVLSACGFLLLGMAPFLLLQLICNHGITGHWFQTPFDYYAERNLPGTSYGFHPLDPNAKVQSVLPQKTMEFEHWAQPYIQRHQPNQLAADWWNFRLPAVVSATLPARPLLILVPIGLLGLTDRRLWVLFAVAPIFLLLYIGYTFFLEHYCLVIAPAVALLIILAIKECSSAIPGAANRLIPAVVFMVLAFAATDLWELNHWDKRHAVDDVPFHSSLMRNLHELTDSNAIVLFRFPSDAEPALSPISGEPVYNIDAPWPDDEPMIRANDLGPLNVELFDYYARIAPSRTARIFDRKTGKVQDLGPVSELANRKHN